MEFPVTIDNSGLSGSWGKTNLLSPSAVYFTVGVIRMGTGCLNPVSGLMMAIASSIIDIAAAVITKGSDTEEEMYFRLTAASVVPLTIGMCLGLSFGSALIMSIIILGSRILLKDYVFEEMIED